MSQSFEEQPFSDSYLESPEYRRRLLRKLNTLIAVLEVACAKVRRSLAGPDPDEERLNRIHKNLTETLEVCMRARRALQRCEKLPDNLPLKLRELQRRDTSPRRKRTERIRSSEETERLSKLGPIDPGEVRTVDLDDLCWKLLQGTE